MTTCDQMDDGTPICLAVTIDRRDGSATFDFEGEQMVAESSCYAGLGAAVLRKVLLRQLSSTAPK